MLEVLILSMLGLAGSALGGAVADDEAETDGESEEENLPIDTSLLMPEVPPDVGGTAERSGEAVFGDGGDDLLTDWHGDVELYGGSGDDIRDGDNDALIYGGDGADTITGGHGRSEIYGDAGDDVIDTGIQSDTVFGGEGDDRLVSVGSGDIDDPDLMFGGAGDDDLYAYGTAGLYGGEGADRFTTYANTWVEDAPVIEDFNPAEDLLCVEIDSHEGVQDLSDFEVEVLDFADGTGASVFVDGHEVMRVPGGQGMGVEDVQLKLV